MSLWEMGRPQERQYSDVLTPQQGVEDKSAATRMSGYASAAESLSSTASTAMTSYGQLEQKQQAAAEVDAYNVYDAGLVQYREMQRKGVSEQKLRGYMADLESKVGAMGLDAKARVTHRAKREGLEMWEKTPEELQDEAIKQAGLDAGFDPNGEDFPAKSRRRWELKNGTPKSIDEFFSKSIKLANDVMTEMGGLSFEQYEAQGKFVMANAQRAAMAFPKEEREGMLKVVQTIVDGHTRGFDPKLKSANKAASLSYLMDSNFLDKLSDSQVLQTVTSIAKLAPNSVLEQQFHNENADKIAKALVSGGKGVQSVADGQVPQASSEEGKRGLHLITSNILDELRTDGLTGQTREMVKTIVDQAPQQIELGKPWEYEAIIDSLFSGVGDAIVEMGAEVDFDRKQRLTDSVVQEFTNNILPIINNAVNKPVIHGGDRRGRGGRPSTPTSVAQYLKAGMWGDRVVFSPQTKEQGVPQHAKNLNEMFSKDLSKFIVTQAKLTGTSPEEVLNTYLPLILPDAQINPIERVGEVSQEGVQQGEPVGNADGISESTQLPELTSQQIRSRQNVLDYQADNPGSAALSGPVPFNSDTGSELLAGRVPGGETPIPRNSPMTGRSTQPTEERGPVVANPTFGQRALRRAQDAVNNYNEQNPDNSEVAEVFDPSAIQGLSDEELLGVLTSAEVSEVESKLPKFENTEKHIKEIKRAKELKEALSDPEMLEEISMYMDDRVEMIFHFNAQAEKYEARANDDTLPDSVRRYAKKKAKDYRGYRSEPLEAAAPTLHKLLGKQRKMKDELTKLSEGFYGTLSEEEKAAYLKHFDTVEKEVDFDPKSLSTMSREQRKSRLEELRKKAAGG